MEHLQHICNHEDWDWIDDYRVCNDCGKIIGSTCPSCNGEGIVEEDEYEGDWVNFSNDLITCPECLGRGWVKERTWW